MPTEEQLKNRELAEQNLVEGKPQDLGVIDSSMLKSTEAVDFQTPQETPIFPVASLQIPELQMTQPEQQAQSITEQLQALQEGLTGESAFRAQKEQEAGISELQKTQQDLSNRLKAIQAEALAIPLQLQEDVIGRAVTEAGLRPIEASALRKNAIQALTTGALLQASQGNLSTALELIDRAVAQKYDPIKEEINAKLNNLNLILESPAYSLADKNRAEKQKAIQEAQQLEIERQENNEKEIKNIMAQAASFGADSETLNRLSNAKTPIEALQIAGYYLGAEFRAKLEEQQFDRVLQEATYNLSIDKFEEDKRQFNLEYARQQQKDALNEIVEQAQNMPSDYSLERSRRTIQSVDGLIGKVSGLTTGFGSWLAILPSTDARNFKAELDTLKSNIAFNELTAMREASKTGGALGQVSDREGKLLESALGALDTGQSPDNFRKNLTQIKTSIENWLNAQGVDLNKTDIQDNVFSQVLNLTDTSMFFNPDTGYVLP